MRNDAEGLKKMLKEGVILRGGGVESSIDLSSDDPVYVAVMFNSEGYGPHNGVVYAKQGGHPDSPLQAADEILDEWMRKHYADHLKELEADALKEGLSEEDAQQRAEEYFRENTNGFVYGVTAMELYKIVSTDADAEKYIHNFWDRSGELNVKIKRKTKKR